MNKNQINSFEKLQDQLFELTREIKELSKKKPDGPLNNFKIKFINSIIGGLNEIIGKQYKPFEDFNIFDTDDMPTNSDVLIILSQYEASASRLKRENTEYYMGDNYWIINGKRTDIQVS